ncbi:hypothetical protein H0I76_18610 [Limibaculum sp. M0105]|uniref:Uncharacterized protein n=1 Tax=Thermohalobaculum xanthum TaxID=2753746 RepID=A0A8J7M9I6_9RHOB|nr:hypothetical protein [Thermohalobaculum xanthum]MBK0401216.1 hypothetical protein [Thermohalobaculum xanthum]
MPKHEILSLDPETVGPRKKSGRPRVDVFNIPEGRGSRPARPAIPIKLRRAIYLARVKIWNNGPSESWRPMALDRKKQGEPDWNLALGGEIGLAAMGFMKLPRSDKVMGDGVEIIQFDLEAKRFVIWFRGRSYDFPGHKRTGPLVPHDDVMKTTLAFAIARYLVHKQGRHHSKLPSPREIAQVLYLLFGEEVPHERIRARLPAVSLALHKFFIYSGWVHSHDHAQLRKALNAISRHYPVHPHSSRGVGMGSGPYGRRR